MAKKKQEEVEETTAEVTETEATEEVTAESNAVSADAATEEKAEVVEEKPKKSSSKKAKADDKVEKAASSDDADKKVKTSKRAEKVGIVASDKMTNTVTVRVDRLVKHPIYRKYIKRKKKFMAHDVLGAKIGDKVRIVETRPLSARKRWRVVEIIQRAES